MTARVLDSLNVQHAGRMASHQSRGVNADSECPMCIACLFEF